MPNPWDVATALALSTGPDPLLSAAKLAEVGVRRISIDATLATETLAKLGAMFDKRE